MHRVNMFARFIRTAISQRDFLCRRHLTITSSLSAEWCFKNIYDNPVDDLQELLQVPLLDHNESAFRPSNDEVAKADGTFDRLHIQTLHGIVDGSQLPVTKVPEVCFIGRSNAGKSSLIKAMLNKKAKVKIHVSKTAGRTTTLNFYNLGQLLTLVDMPGYGENMPQHYAQSVESYITTRPNLVRTFLLIDGAVGLSDVDKIGIEMMEEFGKPYTLVMTKIDQISHHVALRNLLTVKRYREENMPNAMPQIFLVSAHHAVGMPLLKSFILYVTGNMIIKNLK